MKQIKEKGIMTIGETEVIFELYNTELAEDIFSHFPITLDMEKSMQREYCSDDLSFIPLCDESNQTFFEIGDIAYWKKGNALVFFFAAGTSQEVPSGIVVIGKILSDLSIFSAMPEKIRVNILKQ